MSFGLFLIILYFSDTMVINDCSVYIVPLVSTACIHLLMKANPMSSREAMKIINKKRSKVSRTVKFKVCINQSKSPCSNKSNQCCTY